MSQWLFDLLKDVAAGLLVTVAIGILGGFTLWLRKTYQRLSSIDDTMQEIKKLAKYIRNHDRRITRLENWAFDAEGDFEQPSGPDSDEFSTEEGTLDG